MANINSDGKNNFSTGIMKGKASVHSRKVSGNPGGLVDKTVDFFGGGNYSTVLREPQWIGDNTLLVQPAAFVSSSEKAHSMIGQLVTATRKHNDEISKDEGKFDKRGACWPRVRGGARLKNTNDLKINILGRRINTVVGTKFVNFFTGNFLFQISNTQVQTVFSEVFDGLSGLRRYREECIG